MGNKTRLHHVALEYNDIEHADLFFSKILEMQKTKQFTLSKELSVSIFGSLQSVDVQLYENEYVRFEVFIHPVEKTSMYQHVCIEVGDKQGFIRRCHQHGLEPFVVEKEGKELLFVRDFSHYLYEVKEGMTHRM